MTEMNYAGFWRRFGAMWLDILIMSPVIAFVWWGLENFRLFQVFYFLPGIVFGLFYSVYLVQRYGGTPGKRLMKIRILQVSGAPIGYRQASYRYAPEFLFGLMASLAIVSASFSLSDAQYHSVTTIQERQVLLNSARPVWGAYVDLMMNLWVWSEFIVMMTNKKRRALHDFLAGTVVVHDAPAKKAIAPVKQVTLTFNPERTSEAVNARLKLISALPVGTFVGTVLRNGRFGVHQPSFDINYSRDQEDGVRAVLLEFADLFTAIFQSTDEEANVASFAEVRN